MRYQPRRIADRAPVDPFAGLFGQDETRDTPSIQVVGKGSDNGVGSSVAFVDSIGSSFPPAEQAPPPALSHPKSKYAKLKRRAGIGTESSQVLPFEDSEDQEMLEDEHPAKKFKSFDPDVESVASQASQALQKKKEQQRLQLSDIAEEEHVTFASNKPIVKRKATEVGPGSGEELAEDASQANTRRKLSQSVQPVSVNAPKNAKGKRGEASTSQTQEQPKYLQIATGRRKVNKMDAGFNDEFNKLKIVKPVAKESHKMGWNERDVFQEEMAEETRWEPDDKATFFQIRFVPLVRPKGPIRPSIAPVDPRYAGRPNFKAFRPKNERLSQLTGNRRNGRHEIAVVAHEPPGYGLKESYSGGGDHESEEDSVEMPMIPMARSRSGRKRAEGKAPKAADRRRVVGSEEEEEEDEDEDVGMSTTARADSATPMSRTKGKEKETITLNDSSDEDEGIGRTFGGNGFRFFPKFFADLRFLRF